MTVDDRERDYIESWELSAADRVTGDTDGADGVPCPDCDGRGLADDDEPCLNCGGTGWENE